MAGLPSAMMPFEAERFRLRRNGVEYSMPVFISTSVS